MENLLFNVEKVEKLKGFKLFIKMKLMDGEEDYDFSYEEREMIEYLQQSSFEYGTIVSNNVLYFSEFVNKNDEIIDDLKSLKKEIESIIQKSTNAPVALDESLSFDDKLSVFYELNEADDEDLKEDEIRFSIYACPTSYVETEGGLQDWSDSMINDFLENYNFSEIMESCFEYSNYGFIENEKLNSFEEVKIEEVSSIEEVLNNIQNNDLIEFIVHQF